MKENTILALVVGLAIVGGSLLTKSTITVNTPAITVETPDQSFGSIPGDEINSPLLTVNGVKQYHFYRAFSNTSTSTVCSFKTPNASTSPRFVSARLTGNTGGTALVIGKAANDFATTTALATASGQAGNRWNAQATSTLTDGTTLIDNVIPPNSYINVSLEKHTFATGTCEAIIFGL